MTSFRRFACDAARLGFSPRDAIRTAVALDAVASGRRRRRRLSKDDDLPTVTTPTSSTGAPPDEHSVSTGTTAPTTQSEDLPTTLAMAPA